MKEIWDEFVEGFSEFAGCLGWLACLTLLGFLLKACHYAWR